jgi:AcrR family transcriptional regulator
MARARVFDTDHAVQTATELFWRNGYERTSLNDLTTAMGITPPSFYFAFGSKEELFWRVVRHYFETRLSRLDEAFDQPTARSFAEFLLYRLADLYTDKSCPPGCLVVNNSLPCADDEASIRTKLAVLREQRREHLRKRLKDDQKKGTLPADADPDELARYLMTVGWGLAHAAQSGATRAQLHRTVARALTAWPE